MRIYVAEDYKDMSRQAAAILSAQVILYPNSVLGLATGSTPVGMYQELIDRCNRGEVDFSQVRTVNLDEYIGLPSTHPQSYHHFMQSNFFNHINIDFSQIYFPDGMAKDLEDECRRYDECITNLGGVDIQVLGMGHNGHIGFNEPAEFFTVETHVVALQESTRVANARFFDCKEEVPGQAITMGIGSIMQAEKILVIVNGSDKAKAVQAAFAGPVTPQVPASVLQLHRNVILVGDREALNGLL